MPGNNLPAHLPTLVGREESITLVRRHLLETESGLLTLTGAGGSGKTRLALAVAASLLDEFPDGAWLVELAPLNDPALVPAAIMASMGIREQPGRTTQQSLLDGLRTASALLVLDNCEHLVDACANLVAALLSACPRVRILATGREALRIAAERTWRVPTLPVPDPHQAGALDALSKYPSVRLFVERAQAVQPAFALTVRNCATVAAICARLDGLPLGIELAAARTRVLSVEQILDRLQDAFGLLVGGSRSAPRRQQTLRATLEWSVRLLAPTEQRLFERTAVFAGGFDLNAAEAICTAEHLSRADVVEALTGLVDRSMVLAEIQDDATRYRLLEPVRQYAHEMLEAGGKWECVRRRHAEYFVALAEQAEQKIEGAEQKQWMLRLECELGNVRAVIGRCLDAGEAETALRIASALWLFWRQRGYRAEGERWLEEGLARGDDVSTAVRAKALRQIAELANAQSDFQRAAARFKEALILMRELGDDAGTAGTLLHYGRVLTRTATTTAQLEEGAGMLRESLQLYQRPDQFWGAGWALQYIGNTAFEQGDLDAAQMAFEEGVRVLEAGGGHHLRSHLIYQLGRVAVEQGKLDTAGRLLDESLAEARATACDEGSADALLQLACVARWRGELPVATSQAVDSLRLNHKLGLRHQAADCLENLSGIALEQSQPERAIRQFASADALREAVGVPVRVLARPRLHKELSRARATVGPARSVEAWASGRAMTFDQAVAYATQMDEAPPASTAPAHAREILSRREREVATLIAVGSTNREIAEQLIISERTADGHVANILAKLGLKTRSQVAVWAVAQGLATPPLLTQAGRRK